MDHANDAEPTADQQHRIEALRSLANQRTEAESPAAASGPPSAHVRKSALRLWRRWSVVVLVACLLTAGTLTWLNHTTAPRPSSQHRAAPDPLAIALDPSFSCPQSIAWSPDGERVAVLGLRDCASQTPSSSNDFGDGAPPNGSTPDRFGILLVYDATTGHMLTQVDLDDLVVPAAVPAYVRNDSTLMSQLQLTYGSLAWSPDGRQIVLSYAASRQGNDGSQLSTTFGSGLVLVHWSSSEAHPAIHVYPPLAVPPSATPLSFAVRRAPLSSFQHAVAIRWDLSAGTGSIVQIPLAQSYAWDANGTLTATTPLATSPDTPPPPAVSGTIGNPSGGSHFTMWQTGLVHDADHCVSTPMSMGVKITCCPITAYYTAAFGTLTAWSPGGRYVVQSLSQTLGAVGKIPTALAPPSHPVTGGCSDPNLSGALAQLPVRDAALKTVLSNMGPSAYTMPSTNGPSLAALAWSPNGQRLAVRYPNGSASQTSMVSILDCATGSVDATLSSATLLASAPPSVRGRAGGPQVDAVAWSPNSQRMLVLDANQDLLLILGPKSLGG